MKLYHFTAKHLLDSILKEGLTKGAIPLITPSGLRLATPVQWLTTNKDFDQVWNTKLIIKYDRNDVRLTVKIPNTELGRNLIKWTDFIVIPEMQATAQSLNDKEGDFNNWYIYAGIVKKHWIRNIEHKSNIVSFPNGSKIKFDNNTEHFQSKEL